MPIFITRFNPLQKKVNPDLLVEIKTSNRTKKHLEEKLKKQYEKVMLNFEDEQHWYMGMTLLQFTQRSLCVCLCMYMFHFKISVYYNTNTVCNHFLFD